MSNITVTGHSGQKMLRLISAAKRHLNSHHTRAPAFSVGGSVITECAFITGRINNALAFAVCSLLLSLCWWIVSLGRFSNVTVIYDNMMCLERSGSKLFTEGGRTGCHDGEQQAITLPFSLDFGNPERIPGYLISHLFSSSFGSLSSCDYSNFYE